MKRNYKSQELSCSNAKFQLPVLMALMLFLNVLLYAQTPCLGPTNGVIQSLTSDGATITWSSPSPAPWYGFDYYRTTAGFVPTSGTTPTGSTTGNSATFTGIQSNTTSYVYVRSRCGTVTGNTYSQWGGPVIFTTLSPGTGCPVAPYGLFPPTAYTPLYTGNQEVINTDAYAGEYCKVNVLANREFVFSTSVTSDYVTITTPSLNTILAYGPAPLTWNSNGYSGEVRYYISTNSSCGTQQVSRVRSITARLPVSNCGSPNSILVSSIQANQVNLSWTDSSPAVSGDFQYYYSTNSATPSINAGPNGSTNFTYTTISGLTANTTYYYWLRKQCGVNLSQWTFGGTFTTLPSNPSGCFVAIYGQWPPDTFTPNCTGSPEVITPIGRAGEFSVVSILPNRTYTFSSSVATDYITIQDDITDFIYASGLTPLVWSSGANTTEIKYYFHTSSNCGFNVNSRTRAIACAPTFVCSSPNLLAANSITTNGATLTWNAVSPTPSNGYQYYLSTTNTAPSSGTTPTGNSSASSIAISGLNANTTYYFWIRTNCGSSQSGWSAQSSFTTSSVPVCNAPSNVSRFNITSTSADITWSQAITTPSNGYQYYYSTSNTSPTNATIPSGTTPSTGTSLSGLTGGTTYYLWVRSSCESLFSAWISGGSFTTLAATCNPPSFPASSDITANSAQIDWLAAVPSPTQYDVYLATSSTAPNSGTTPIGSIPGTSGILNDLATGTTYYFWVRSNCGATQSAWISGGSFTTTTVSGDCTDAPYGLFPADTYTPTCTGTAETIVNNAYAGEYSLVNVLANKQYTFLSSTFTDYITITNQAGTVVYTSGTSPVVWQSGAVAEVIRYYFHTNSNCGTENVDRARALICAAPTPTCAPPTSIAASNITNSQVTLQWSAVVPAPSSYQFYYNTTNVTPTNLTAANGSSLTTTRIVSGLTGNTTYYLWGRCFCGPGASVWISGGSFTTLPDGNCNTAVHGLLPSATFNPSCTGVNQQITAVAWASEYSNVAITSNKEYTFTSSKPTDYITITNAAATTIYAEGTTPLIWQSGSNSGVIRYYFHANITCGEESVSRIKSIKCSTTLDVTENQIEGLQVFPNPTSSLLNISNTSEINSIEITNILGQHLKQQTINATNAVIDMSGYTAGIYLVKVYVGNSNQTFKISKN